MSQKPLQIFAELSCKPGEEARVEVQGVAFVKHTRSQPGCLDAALHRVEEEPRFLFIAEFADEEALATHLASAWRKDALGGLPELLASWPRRFTMRRVA
jgi:quinol monooxygenase YgiN